MRGRAARKPCKERFLLAAAMLSGLGSMHPALDVHIANECGKQSSRRSIQAASPASTAAAVVIICDAGRHQRASGCAVAGSSHRIHTCIALRALQCSQKPCAADCNSLIRRQRGAG